MYAVLQFSSIAAWLLHEQPPGRSFSLWAVTPLEWLAGLVLIAAGQVSSRSLDPTFGLLRSAACFGDQASVREHLNARWISASQGLKVSSMPNVEGAVCALGIMSLQPMTNGVHVQALNVGIYRAIGNPGVYYGFKLGHHVPWHTGFPFNVVSHPQYVGSVLTVWGFVTLVRP